ncbi:MAG: MATE family efflux transporter [Mycoplasmoidaceae bacterium]
MKTQATQLTKYKPKSLVNKIFVSTIFLMTLTCLSNTFTSLFGGWVINQIVGSSGASGRALCNTVDKLCIAISQLFGLGSQIVVAKQMSDGKKEFANKIFNFNIFVVGLLGISISLIIMFLSKYLVLALSVGKPDVTQDILNAGRNYLLGYAIGIPFVIINQSLVLIIYLDGDRRLVQISILGGIGIECLMEWLLATYMPNKMLGVGLSSAITALTLFSIFICHFFKKTSSFHFAFNFKKLKKSFMKDVLVQGSPMALKYFVITLKVYLINIILINVGSMSLISDGPKILLTVRAAQDSVSVLFESPLGGIIMTTIMLGTVFYDEQDDLALKQLMQSILKFVAIVCTSLFVIYMCVAPYLARVFLPKDTPSYGYALNLTTFGMRCGAFTLLFLWINSSFLGFLQASKRIKYAFIATILQSLVIPVSCFAIFGFSLGLEGIFIGFAINTTLYGIIHYLIAIIKNKKFPTTIQELFFFDKDFGYNKKQQLNYSIENKKQLKELRVRADEFCKINKIDMIKKTNLLWNIDNVLLRMICKKNKKKLITLRIVYTKHELLLMTRDYQKPYNVLKSKLERKIKNHSKSATYSYILKTNNIVFSL